MTGSVRNRHHAPMRLRPTLKQSIANNIVDQPDQAGARCRAGTRRRWRCCGAPKRRRAALIHDRVTEIYQIVEGSGTLVTGGSLEDPTETDLTRLNAGPSHTGTHKGGESRQVGPKDVIIVPAGMPHRFSELDGPIVYLVYRFEPKRRLQLLVGRVAIVEPRLRGVRVAADFPEALLVLREELDLADPLRALPRIQLRRDHPARTAVLARQRLALPRVHQQHVVVDRARERQVDGVGDVACPA